MHAITEPKFELNLGDTRKAHQLLHANALQTELRVKFDSGVMSGVFDDDVKLFEWITDADESAVTASWWSIQPLSDTQIHNDMQYRNAVGNKDVKSRRFIMVDVDAVRATESVTGKPFGAASESELAATRAKVEKLQQWLKSNGILPEMTVMTGNGFQMYLRVADWPNDDVANNLVKAFLEMLDSRFSDGTAVIDVAVARIGGLARIPGTINRKGENTPERPWRQAQIVEINNDVAGLSTEFVHQLVQRQGIGTEPPMGRRRSVGMHEDFDVQTFAEWLDTDITNDHVGSDGRLYYHLSPCPNVESDHRGAPSKCCLVLSDDGIGFSCFSDDCEDVTIGDLMRKAAEKNGSYSEPLFDEPDPEDILPIEDVNSYSGPPLPRLMTMADLFADEPCKISKAAPSEKVEVPTNEPIAERDTPKPVFGVDSATESCGEFQMESNSEELTDVGNGARLARIYGHSIRMCKDDGKWYIWSGKRWKADHTNHVFKLAKEAVRSILKEAHESKTEDEAKLKIKWYATSSAKTRLEAMVWSAQSEGDISVRSNTFDQNHSFLNAMNGTLDLESMTLRKHRRSDLITKIVPFEVDAEAKCPLWEKFLADIMLGNNDNIEFLQRMAGYSLSGNTSEQCFAILHGTGSNGKGTFINTLRKIMGDYAQQSSFDSFAVTRNEKSIRNDLAGLVGKRMVSASESEAGIRLSEALIKQLTGCDPITVRFLHREYFEYLPTYKIWLSTNYKPRIVGSDHGIWRRIRLIPFNATFDGENQDKRMAEKLMAEAPGILNWMIQGYKKWKIDGLPVPKEIEDATASYRSEQDTIAQFVEAACERGQGYRVSRRDLYHAYVEWAKETGEYPLSHRVLISAMSGRGYKPYRLLERGWEGIRLSRAVAERSKDGGDE